MNREYKPSTMLSNDELREQLERLDAEVKADRKARGVPPEPPADFVPIAMAWTLYKRCEPLYKFAIKYANIVDKANEIVELSEDQKEWISQFKMGAVLIRKTDDTLLMTAGVGVDWIIELLTNQSNYELVGEYLRLIYQSVQLTKSDYGEYRLYQFTYNHKFDNKENERILEKTEQEVERLKDEEYFEQELERLTEHYQEIKHLY